MNPFAAYLHSQLEDNLKQRRIVVWYDPNREFCSWVDSLAQTGPDGGVPMVQVGNTKAGLARFEGSYFALRMKLEPWVAVNRPQPLIVYLPGEKRDAKGSVLMELELAGTSWEPQMKRLARNVMRKSYSDGVIDEMLAPEGLNFTDICSLLEQRGGDKGSILQIIFDTPDNVAVVAAWLGSNGHDKELERRDGVRELLKLLESRAGFSANSDEPLPKVREKFGRYVVIHEFRHDLRCDPPAAVSMMPAPSNKEQREFCLKVLDHVRTRHAEAFEKLADSVEDEYGLAKCGIQASDLGSIDTFRFEERAMLKHCGERIVEGDYEGVAKLVTVHSQSFWARHDLSRRQAQWEVCALLAALGVEVERVEGELKKNGLTAKGMFDRYVAGDGWHRLDWAHRRLECRIAQMEEEPENDHAIAMLRARVEEVLKAMAVKFGKALAASGWSITGALHQTQIWPQKVAPQPGRVACFFVDALRFEIGTDLLRQISEAADAEITPALTVLPSITPLGMAALLPGASASYSVVEHQGKVGAKIGNQILTDVNERMKHLKAQVPDAVEITLERLLQDSPAKVSAKIEPARIVVVRSQEIDALGEKNELLARNIMDTAVGNLARAVRRLAGMGIERFVITADHGHVFSARKEDDMKTPATAGGTIELHRRAWIGRGASASSGTVSIRAPELGYDSNLEFVFPEGMGVFKAGGSLAYHHGGFSLQEIVIPVVSFRMLGTTSAAVGPKVRIVSHPTAITTRTFGVEIEAEPDLLASEPMQLRILLANKGEEAGYAGMAMTPAFDRESRILTLKAGTSASLALVLSREDFDTVRIVVQDAQTGASLAETSPIPLQLKL